MEQIANLLQNTLTPTDSIRKQAEAELTTLRESPEKRQQLNACLLEILRLASMPAGIRQAAAIFLQNSIAAQWNVESEFPLTDNEKDVLRSSILETVFLTDRKVRSALTWSITKIAECDFPKNWPGALSIIKAKLELRDAQVNQIAFAVIIALLCKYDSHTGLTHEIVPELIKVNQELAGAALVALEQATASSDFTTAELGTNVFYHLCKLDFSDEIEQTLPRWMKAFHTFLQYPENKSTRTLKAAAIDAVNLFLCKYSEDFEKYKDHFIPIIWKLLCDDHEESDDRIKISGLEFLSTVAKSSFWETLASEETLRHIFEQVVIRNIFARPYEIDRITEDAVQFIRTDIEGSNAETRRRAACNLASAMSSGKLEKLGRPVVTAVIQSLLSVAYGDISKHWLEMDAALCLIFSLSVKREQTSLNNAFVSDALCNLEEVYQRFVAPELSTQATDHIVLKADALKFVCHFRCNFPTDMLVDLLCLSGNWIFHENRVVAIYAAHCVDQIFSMSHLPFREIFPANKAVGLASNILTALEAHSPADSDRIAKSLSRISQVFRGNLMEMNSRVVALVEKQLKSALQNEVDTAYMHYLHESLGYILTKQNVMEIQAQLFDVLIAVLHQNVESLVPYVLQILAQCIRVSEGSYERPLLLTTAVLDAQFYSNRQYVPSVVLFTSTVFRHYRAEYTDEYIPLALALFDQLAFVKPLDHEGFALLGGLVDSWSFDVIRSNLGRILQTICRRLSAAKTNKFVKNLVIWMSRCVLVLQSHTQEGVNVFLQQVEQIQTGLLEMLLRNVWLPSLEWFVHKEDRELVITAMIGLLLGSESLVANRALWTECLVALCRLIQKNSNTPPKESQTESAGKELQTLKSHTLSSCQFLRAVCVRDEPSGVFLHQFKSFAASRNEAVIEAIKGLPPAVRDFIGLGA
ncbi:CAS/CSE/importin domain protein [Perkinsela sp. CCAP 1560/4]|nr:CAS/CSE/importin domain protein [Perkinsela sp. CCAP 1560/4]|eukprot:KNH06317.1 CAS/CSE/importin domain protein [Perkinsela sp. CCAP 1560/4]